MNWEDLEPGDVLIDQEDRDISDFLFIRSYKSNGVSHMLWLDLSDGSVLNSHALAGPIKPTQFEVVKRPW